MISRLKKIVPRPAVLVYHYLLALTGALLYRRPGRSLTVIGITGTKGKSSTVEIINSILEEAGHKTALSSTIRFKIGNDSQPNLKKMTQPGRFFQQQFLHRAVKAGCDVAVMEMTSEGVKQFRHRWLELNTLIFTNLSPEHIESHGSYENYLQAKLKIAKELNRSSKDEKQIIANRDDAEHSKFLEVVSDQVQKMSFSLKELSKVNINQHNLEFNFKQRRYHSPLRGKFNLYNILAGLSYCLEVQKIDPALAIKALSKLDRIPGRVELVKAGQSFEVVIDYAHTPDSLEKFYQAFDGREKICVLGNTGGGRDKWKRPVMAEIADRYCNEIILTNEDPYDEDPKEIVKEMSQAVKSTPCQIIIDRRQAIKTALDIANKQADRTNAVVLISGKGTDPYIMEANGQKTSWSDKRVAEEELEKVLSQRG